MNYLLDVNALIAWAWTDHPHHLRVDEWMATVLSKKRKGCITTTPIVQLGFIRVSVQRNPQSTTIAMTTTRLTELIEFLAARHRFLADDVDSFEFPEWCVKPSSTTDSHLLALAEKHGLKLATLATGIPGAFLIP